MNEPLVICGNCDEKIGRLETAHLWNNAVVCGRCHIKLSASVELPQNDPVADDSPAFSHSQLRQAQEFVNPQAKVHATTDQVVGRVILIIILIAFILACASVIVYKIGTWQE